MAMPSGVFHTLKGHGLYTAKTWTEHQRVPQIDHPAASFGIFGYWCKVTVAEATVSSYLASNSAVGIGPYAQQIG